jgi:hypothetical protein
MNHVRQEDHYQADASGREEFNWGGFRFWLTAFRPAS